MDNTIVADAFKKVAEELARQIAIRNATTKETKKVEVTTL